MLSYGLESTAPSAGNYYLGKEEGPITDDELSLLMAVPRAAESTPNAVLFRLPLGPDPSFGWVDATCAEVRSIVARLAAVWQSKLLEVLNMPDECPENMLPGPGITICILVEPSYQAIFHLLAFWAIGCTVQFISVAMDPATVDTQLNQSGCKIIMYSGFDDAWINERRIHFHGAMVPLPYEEHASRLVLSQKHQQTKVPPPWPIPRRPTPALILQSSATTGEPKLLRFPLHIYTIGHVYNCRTYLQPILPGRTSKSPYTHPRLVLSPLYWQSFYRSFFVHLTTATPLAFAHIKSIVDLSSSQVIDWAMALDVGAIASVTGLIRQIPVTTLEHHASFFRTLFSFTLSGSAIDFLSHTLERLQIPITNLYGTSELGRLLYSTEPPYTHLRPYADAPQPLVLPISDYAPDGSRHVELWYSSGNSPHLAHYLAHGGIPLELEPFPGYGPHRGELCVNLGDIFQEIPIRDTSKIVYVHIGRHSDQIRLGGSIFGILNAALYESQLRTEIGRCTGRVNGNHWQVDAIQLFGTNMQCTALVIQLCTYGRDPASEPDGSFIQEVYKSIQRLNDRMELGRGKRVHVKKRVLITTSNGAFVHGPGAEVLAGLHVSLSMTHKRTPKRWENVCRFKPWLEKLDFSEP
ncbi:hypothetical protein RSOLAG1IB_12123 [Rhizoctonia solani AG-1 IB]|uniref:AMP-dependent synthetase/ligase domain-containing protein n=1 Tax=Thanatephorus cucumeris (strain AG1-IB / isolate 7/3/14) TaxID=1108050 RepID=A0A0B7FLA3_THACB|nr:hypothetical protein RSOLAG1IB_12123 [Rhizoctonia solani AG-1 IB]